MTRVCILGLTVTGNRGAESMLLSILHNMRDRVGECQFDLVSVYAKKDSAQPLPKGLRIVDGSPLLLMLVIFPLCVVCSPFRKLTFVQNILRKFEILRSYLDADIILDSGGVAFIDGRGFPLLVYNTALAITPALLGKPVVKLAQALGPFKECTNRTLAKLTLGQMGFVVARGRITGEHLAELGLNNYEVCADTAFTMPLSNESCAHADSILEKTGVFSHGTRVIGISPSVVVDDYCRAKNIDYASTLARFIDHFVAKGFSVVILPHSVRPDSQKRMNNDVIIGREIMPKLSHPERVAHIEQELAADVLRHIIGRMDFYVASRFHSMVSALSMKVPTLLIGWSHKYQEVMEMFDMAEWAMGYEQVSERALIEKFEQLMLRESEIRQKFESHLESVRASSLRNFDIAANLVAKAA